MGMVAKPQVNSAEKDVTDVDDGAEKVTAGTFWPEILLRDLRLASRIPGRTTTSRLKFVTTEAVAHVTDQLDDWRGIQESAGYSTLADVPARMLNGESVKVYRYRRAVYSAALLRTPATWTPPKKATAKPTRWKFRPMICGAMCAGP